MPRIPRRSEATEEAAAPQEQRTDGGAPSTDPPTPQPDVPAARAEAPTEIVTPGQATVESPAADQPTVAAQPVDATTSGDPLAGATAMQPEGEPEQAPLDARPRFRERTRMRRRLRYLRRLRELAFRDLGGLVFDLHRFGRDRNDLVAAKLEALATIDRELRVLEGALEDRREFTDLREAGIAACPRCGTLHDTDANFCPGCGSSLRTSIVRDAAPVTVTPADEQQQAGQQPSATGS